jgi:hypothetical protein
MKFPSKEEIKNLDELAAGQIAEYQKTTVT